MPSRAGASRADMVGSKVEMSRCDRADVVGGKVEPVRPGRRGRQQSSAEMLLSSYQTLIFVQVLSRDGVNYFYISIKLVVVIR